MYAGKRLIYKTAEAVIECCREKGTMKRAWQQAMPILLLRATKNKN